jgi:hypothetical protein
VSKESQMEFFERLYRGFEAEHYVAGKLFSVGYEAFKVLRWTKNIGLDIGLNLVL